MRRFDQTPGPSRRPFLSAHSLLGLDETVTDRRGLDDEGWRLSPAFDLTPSVVQAQDSRLLAMAVGRLPTVEPRWANRANLLSGAAHFGMSADEADTLVSDMKDRVLGRWREVVAEVGGRPAVADRIAHAFADRYPGFEYSPEPC